MTREVRHAQRHEIHDLATLRELIASGESLQGYILQGVDLSGWDPSSVSSLDDVLMLGCVFQDEAQRLAVVTLGASLFPHFKGLPYDPYRADLYSVEELFHGYEEGGYCATSDFRIYEHFDKSRRLGFGVSICETLAQSLHDHAMEDALAELLELKGPERVVGVMGGHGTRRDDPFYRRVAYMTWALTRAGYFIASGGGPGIMEAANLGAYLANFSNEAILDEAIAILSRAPKFDGGQKEGTPEYLAAIDDFIARGRDVIARVESIAASDERAGEMGLEREAPGESLAVPTWFYGHEPSNLFSTHVAKYFANSMREDGLLAISLAGVIFAPGSAGTWQEVFMDLAQNHYATFTQRSPMVFLGEESFGDLYALVRGFIADKGKEEVYGDMVALFEDPREVVSFIQAHPPRPREEHPPLYEIVGN